MGWVAAAIFGVAVIYFAIHYSGFRKVVLWSLAVIVALSAAVGLYLHWDSVRQAERTAYARKLLKRDDIEFFGLTMGENSIGSQIVRGNVRNRNSIHTLKGFTLRITVQDCPNERCETIGQEDLLETYINVPPGQVRAFERYMTFSGMPTPKAQKWYFTVKELEARLD